jgi:hypothetical protein
MERTLNDMEIIYQRRFLSPLPRQYATQLRIGAASPIRIMSHHRPAYLYQLFKEF